MNKKNSQILIPTMLIPIPFGVLCRLDQLFEEDIDWPRNNDQ